MRFAPVVSRTTRSNRGTTRRTSSAGPPSRPIEPDDVALRVADLVANGAPPAIIDIGDSVAVMRIRHLDASDVSLIRRIDRSEHVDVQYAMRDGQLVEAPVFMEDIPTWPDDGGERSITKMLEFCTPIVEGGGTLLGAFIDGDELAGLAIVDPTFEPPLAWLALLHVSRPHRRAGAATALWAEAARIASGVGASSMYVSATPTGSAVGFYLSRGCRLADPVHPVLFEREPEDIHLVCELRQS